MSAKRIVLAIVSIFIVLFVVIIFAISGRFPLTIKIVPSQDLINLQKTTWEITSIQIDGSIYPVGDTQPTIQFIDDRTVGGFGGCNSYSGSVELRAGGIIHFGEIISTVMACDHMEVETVYFQSLAKVVKYSLSEGSLTLSSDDGKTNLHFMVKPE